ncbi:MAG: serine acetyltransferase [Proteobacteria bacterium]|nr:serine acetyltransferase [Pseudomonadota bacterium]
MILEKLWSDAKELAKTAFGEANSKHLLRSIITTDSYKITTIHRLRELALKLSIPGANHVLRTMQTVLYGIELDKKIELGSGVYFIHPWGIVVGGDSKVGNRVRFYGNNTVGTATDNGNPVIEDDVQIGAGARILGPVCIGARSFVGANAVVMQDIPPDSIAVGIPAKIKPRTAKNCKLTQETTHAKQP